MRLSRRGVLAGAVSSLATAAFADAPLTSLRPALRPPSTDAVARLVRQAGLSGTTCVAVVDLKNGEPLEALAADLPQPPASVTKAFTALYAIETLSPSYVFKTRIFADGQIQNGVLDGNLILAGGGNPNLVTDDLAALAKVLKDIGLIEVKGDFLVWDNALRNVDEIDSAQLDYLGYNPSITGLNLNFNRVHFEWKLEGEDYVTAMDARSENYRPVVTGAKIRVVDRAFPVFTYRDVGDTDQWTVARGALNKEGSRWLPVRHPALYAGEVFATFARSNGIVLKAPQELNSTPPGSPIAEHGSAPLADLMRGMLRFSTNITAEAAGLAASQARTGAQRGLRTSAFGMARWANARCGGISPSFVDHSGLGDASRVSAHDMVRMLTSENVKQVLQPILRNVPVVGADDEVVERPGLSVKAKTGTLNFVSTLAGYVDRSDGRELAFAIFSSDLDAREAGKQLGDETPPGARSWSRRARRPQRDIVSHLALARL